MNISVNHSISAVSGGFAQKLADMTRGNALKASISLLSQPDFRPKVTVKLGGKTPKLNRPNFAHVQERASQSLCHGSPSSTEGISVDRCICGDSCSIASTCSCGGLGLHRVGKRMPSTSAFFADTTCCSVCWAGSALRIFWGYLFAPKNLFWFAEVIFKDPPKIPFKTSIKITSWGYFYIFWGYFLPREVISLKKACRDS